MMQKPFSASQIASAMPDGLAAKLDELRELNAIWQKYIDIELIKHSRVANWRDGCLIIEADSAAWAVPIRYEAPALLKKMQAEKKLSGLKNIRWYIKPQAINSENKQSVRKMTLSAENAGAIKEMALTVKNGKLKQAILELAKNSKS